jgi:[glutamine synthetase] adenylyltransferase / [glutamine synthetase]-adenylyl-L-tyrosine phosphorylase
MAAPGDPTSAPLLPGNVRFRQAQRARENFQRISERAPRELLAVLVTLLTDLPDPDSALNLFQRFCESATDDVLRQLQREPVLVHYALSVFAHSQYLGDALIRNPDLFAILARDKGVDREHTREEFHEHFARLRARSSESDFSALLARFKKREYVRIMLRDLLGIATLADTTSEISALSDVLIEEALRDAQSRMRNRFGASQHLDEHGRIVDTRFTVLSLGKLGGNELNYSSDVDLLFLFEDGPGVSGAALTNREYCVRLAQEVTTVLSSTWSEGLVFRVDLRLRPQGSEGDPAISLQHALRYYSQVAQDWELQALIKVRHSAGDRTLAREFIRTVQPLVYRGELNFSAIETALIARRKQNEKHRSTKLKRSSSQSIDVKIDPGGIREIEFLVQCLQRVHGGVEPWLRSGGTLFSLQKLHDKGHITGHDFHLLTSTYEFLRTVEHRLQLKNGQQRHHLPSDPQELQILADSVDPDRAFTPAGFVDGVQRRLTRVSDIYRRIIHQQRASAESGTLFALQPPEIVSSETAITQVLSRLRVECPEGYEIASDPAIHPVTRKNLHRFLSSALTSSRRFAILLEHASKLRSATQLFRLSEFLTDILIGHPEEVAVLQHPLKTKTVAPTLLALDSEPAADPVFEYAATSESMEEAMAMLRRHYRHTVFVAGADEVAQGRGAYESLAASTRAAESAMRAAHLAAGSPNLSIWALGRLGSREFDLLSDADLLFVCNDSSEVEHCTRSAEKIVHLLAAYTTDGSVFPVDTRLRPHGNQGDLVVTTRQLHHYLTQEAQAWEALTYTKLRHIAGPSHLERGEHWDWIFERFADAPEFVLRVREMRERLQGSAKDDFKVGPGGLYDIDFIIAFLAIRNRVAVAPDTMRMRIRNLESAGVLSSADAEQLDSAAEFLRATEHAVRLATATTRKSLPNSDHGREAVQELVSRALEREISQGIEQELRATLKQIRALYDRLLLG